MSSVLESSAIEATPSDDEFPYLISTDEFYRMLDGEVFPEDARLGLWDGRIYEKMSKTQAHAVASMKVNNALTRILPPGWTLSGENPITVGPKRAPLPDLIVLKGAPDDYNDHRPGAADVGLVVELSLSSLKEDTGPKLAAYASAGISAYWVLNLVDGVVLVHTDPIPVEGRYASMAAVKRGESFPFALDGIQVGPIAASDLLPAK